MFINMIGIFVNPNGKELLKKHKGIYLITNEKIYRLDKSSSSPDLEIKRSGATSSWPCCKIELARYLRQVADWNINRVNDVDKYKGSPSQIRENRPKGRSHVNVNKART